MTNKRLLITGATGFFGSILKEYLRAQGWDCFNLDKLECPADTQMGRMIHVDLRDAPAVHGAIKRHGPFKAVCHLAAELAHEADNPKALWASNVDGTRNIAEACKARQIKKLIFTSTNCLWGKPLNRPVREDDAPAPIEVYGRSKAAAEELLHDYEKDMAVVIFRSPTIIAAGRVGLLSILFDMIEAGCRIPVVGSGTKSYQFIDAYDYARAIEKALDFDQSAVMNIGSDNPTSLEAAYRTVIEKAHSRSRIYHLPTFPTLLMMRLCHALHLSPLGPYHYSMIAEEFVFDTTRIKTLLDWQPTRTNGEILYEAYVAYIADKQRLIANAATLPPHQRRSREGIIRLLRFFS